MTEHQRAPVRIALAEDEPDLRRAYVSLLTHMGHVVVCDVGDGAQLLAACDGLEIDVAILDLEMPVMDGLTAAEDLTERGIPVVLVSGHPDARALVLEEEPVVTRILKPATLDSLSRAIDQALAQRQRQL